MLKLLDLSDQRSGPTNGWTHTTVPILTWPMWDVEYPENMNANSGLRAQSTETLQNALEILEEKKANSGLVNSACYGLFL